MKIHIEIDRAGRTGDVRIIVIAGIRVKSIDPCACIIDLSGAGTVGKCFVIVQIYINSNGERLVYTFLVPCIFELKLIS